MVFCTSDEWLAKYDRFRIFLILLQVTVSVFIILWIFLGIFWRQKIIKEHILSVQLAFSPASRNESTSGNTDA